MTPEEARAELMNRFPGQTVSAYENKVFTPNSTTQFQGYYSIMYNYWPNYCSRKNGSSFEDCFSQLDKENTSINSILNKYSILLRQF